MSGATENAEGSAKESGYESGKESAEGPLAALTDLLNDHVVAHDDVKKAVLLALVCREHIYVEGPPGTAKTRLAELTAKGCGLEFFFYQLHRDTRLAELVGDIVLERRDLEEGKGEQIHQRIEPGGILTAEICVLDDVSRAPGEALNVLLRILNERKFHESSIPLMSAIATGNPMDDEYYNEPLDPANLDRFALQLRVHGLIQDGAKEARLLVDRFADGSILEQPEPDAVLDRATLGAAFESLAGIEVPNPMREALVEFLRTLVVEFECTESNSLLTDRSFLVKAVKILRGNAYLRGDTTVTAEDLKVLNWMTTFRLPPEVHDRVPELIARVSLGH